MRPSDQSLSADAVTGCGGGASTDPRSAGGPGGAGLLEARELQRERAVVGVEQREPRRHQIEAFNRDPAAQQSPAAQRNSCGGRHDERFAPGVGDAYVAKFKLQQARIAQTQRNRFNAHARIGQLLGDAVLERADQKVEGNRPVQQTHIKEPGDHDHGKHAGRRCLPHDRKRAAALARARLGAFAAGQRPIGRAAGRPAVRPGPGHTAPSIGLRSSATRADLRPCIYPLSAPTAIAQRRARDPAPRGRRTSILSRLTRVYENQN